ncbi:dipeptide epimerase [Terrihabitans soli]|uniref:Dipeptide epimerase n=1 Tax=Terrihabitans soli TaxID=708113 RepID=A0A6S6QLQ7_9HYPH|nr:N-acetyl-D-Glu racemase DgcA [Terrihabitans soli]BCJ91344.1 dipeptide epimerase [Terrihabitans soli]
MAEALNIKVETWPIAGRFAIARGAKTEAHVVVAEVTGRGHTGRGECVPYARYGESVDSVVASLESVAADIANGLRRAELQARMKPGAARNALDCALWDLEAKTTGRRVWELAGLPAPQPVTTAYTISLGTPDEMAAAAAKASARPLLKIKLGTDGDSQRLLAVRHAAPKAELIVDANEGWTKANLDANIRACADAGVTLIEQPLPASDDALLESIARKVPVCADESVHGRAGLAALRRRYDAVNIKLDKTGGLTEAIALAAEAESLGFSIMVGCMVGTSLAMAPALLIASRARFVDLDGPLLLARDRAEGLVYEGSCVHPPAQGLWG